MIKIFKLVPSYTWRDLPELEMEIELGILLGLLIVFIGWFCAQCWNKNKIAFIIGLVLFVFCVLGGLFVENIDD